MSPRSSASALYPSVFRYSCTNRSRWPRADAVCAPSPCRSSGSTRRGADRCRRGPRRVPCTLPSSGTRVRTDRGGLERTQFAHLHLAGRREVRDAARIDVAEVLGECLVPFRLQVLVYEQIAVASSGRSLRTFTLPVVGKYATRRG